LATIARKVGVIYVDLDHTLLCVDLLRERLILAMLNAPTVFFRALFWLCRGGRARLKVEIARRYPVHPAGLPFNEELLSFLQVQRQSGIRLVLATAAPAAWGQAIAGHLGIFDSTLATDLAHGNLKGRRKLELIRRDAGDEPFGYAGDARADRPIFEAAQLPIVVGHTAALAGTQSGHALVLERRVSGAKRWWMSLRPHQWSKNVLIFAPILAAHRMDHLWLQALLAFGAFSMLASALYLLNDLYDIDLDRQHPEKRLRSLAVGTLQPSTGLLLAILLFTATAALSFLLPLAFGLILLCYGLTNVLYSRQIKRIPMLDVVTLAFLYTIRILAGGAACAIPVSIWLAALIFFIALSLAHLKRYIEIAQRSQLGLSDAARPAYAAEDMLLLAIAGVGSGLFSVLVLALYISSAQIDSLYKIPPLLFAICVLQFYWIERIWMLAFRRRMVSDPIVFIVTDWVSYLIAGGALAIAFAATAL
jgi:4-hydroxybenzoate polyprenyltransferase